MNAPPTRRVAHGRGHRYLLDGEAVTGVTTILGDGVPKPALIDWAARTTAGYAVDHWDELAEMKQSERLRTLEKARWADVKAAGVRGTDVHQLAQRLAAGEEIDVPEHLLGHVDAYLAFTQDWQPRELVTEAVVGNRRHRYMGTLDLIAQLADDQAWLLDWKTSGSGIWPENALQLAAYRYSEFYLDADGQEQPLPLVARCGCVWLRADGYDLVPVHADPDTFRTFLYAQQVAQFTKTPKETHVLEALTAPVKEAPAA